MSARGRGVTGRPARSRTLATRDQQAARFHRETDPRLRRTMVAAMVCAACVAGAVLGVVALKVQQVRLSYRLDELRTARAQALETNRRLGVELASLSSPARLERRARTELGMIQPSREQVRLAREFVPGGTGAAAAERRTAAAGRLAPARGVSR